MAKVHNMRVKNDKILVTFEISDEEYRLIRPRSKRVVILPVDALDDTLTTGRLGNSNRIMLPTKILSRYKINELVKKAPSRIFETFEGKYLIIELEKGGIGVPVFRGENNE